MNTAPDFASLNEAASFVPTVVTFETPSSSSVDKIVYTVEAASLSVTFKRGDVYDYTGVPISVLTDIAGTIRAGESVGSYIARRVARDYPYTKRPPVIVVE